MLHIEDYRTLTTQHTRDFYHRVVIRLRKEGFEIDEIPPENVTVFDVMGLESQLYEKNNQEKQRIAQIFEEEYNEG